jgi:ACS family hexuronate transporter-like MFS transporter
VQLSPSKKISQSSTLGITGIGKYRWTICALVFFATTINYLDRQTISLLKTDLDAEFGWTKTDYANITVAFQLTYALAMFGVGRLIDKLGTKIGYALSLFLWSLAAIGHAFVKSTTGFPGCERIFGTYRIRKLPICDKGYCRMVSQKGKSLSNRNF